MNNNTKAFLKGKRILTGEELQKFIDCTTHSERKSVADSFGLSIKDTESAVTSNLRWPYMTGN